jgi:hypothetical protein
MTHWLGLSLPQVGKGMDYRWMSDSEREASMPASVWKHDAP